MDATRLKRWKERERNKAEELAGGLLRPSPKDITKLYPEFTLKGVYTTSLDPYVPLWVLLPFFDKIIVGIMPYLRTEDDFRRWYGLTVRQMLSLYEQQRIHLRVLFPSAATTTPRYLNPFFSAEFPSTARDLAFDRRLLGPDRFVELQRRFALATRKTPGDVSIDGFTGHRGRAFRTAQTAYVQLHALGYSDHAFLFERMYGRAVPNAMRWLEVCRLFLIGPIHYSLSGIHCVADVARIGAKPQIGDTVEFPTDLGRILVNALSLARFRHVEDSFGVNDCVAIFPDFEAARTTLLELESAVASGAEKATLNSACDLRHLIVKARSRQKNWLRIFRLAAATGISAACAPFGWLPGLLAGLGFGICSEFWNDQVDKVVAAFTEGLRPELPRHLTLLIDLDDRVRAHFRAE